MARSTTPVGRLDFLFRTLLVTALEVALERLLHGRISVQLNSLPPMLRSVSDLAIFGFSAMFVGNAFKGRLLDAGLPGWYMRPIFLIWALATILLDLGAHYWASGLSLFVPLLIAGVLISSKPLLLRPDSEAVIAKDGGNALARNGRIPAGLLVGSAGFLRSLLTLACLCLPLIWVKGMVGRSTGTIAVDFGYCVLYIIWTFKVLGRFADSGRSSNWYWLPFCVGVSVVSALPLWFQLINHYEALALFLLIQLPLALLPSDPTSARPRNHGKRKKRFTTWRGEVVRPLLFGRSSFLLGLLIVAGLWALLIYTESASESAGFFVWLVRLGYFILAVAWMVIAGARFTDAGLDVGWYTSQYFLVVSVASLMPLAVHWVNGYGSLAIFVLIQTPTAFLKSNPKPEEPSLETDERAAQV